MRAGGGVEPASKTVDGANSSEVGVVASARMRPSDLLIGELEATVDFTEI